MATPVVSLPKSLRTELKEPAGPIFTDTEALLAEAGEPLFAVGDVVTYHLIEAGCTPDVALVDEQTERTAVDDEISSTIANFDGFDRELQVENPAAVLTDELLTALNTAMAGGESTLLAVDGEEDLAALAVIVAAPLGASVVYGQPGEGMVHVTVDEAVQSRMRDLIARMDGDPERLFSLLELN